MRWLVAYLFIILPLDLLAADSPLAIERVLWGFDGKPIMEAFSPLTVEVANLSDEPFTGTIQLERRLGNSLSGVPELQSISLAPGGRRTVQFTPYLEQHLYADWRITWLSGRHNLEEVTQGDPAIVELMSSDWTEQNSTSSLPKFPEHYFPTNASATVGLATVLLSHVPDWGSARAQAFLQWLKRGGTLHVFPGPSGDPLSFSGELAELTAAIDAGMLGNGAIIRHTTPLKDLPEQTLTNLTSALGFKPSNDHRNTVWRDFGRLTLPDVPWTLVYLAAFVYLCLIGPGHFLYARGKKRDYRIIILILLVCVGAFSWLFSKIGRRGFDESDQWLSAGIAYALGDGTYDVEQWSHAFVTKGNSYQFRMRDSNALFSMQHQQDRVPGLVRGGPGGHLQLDMPLYSSRNLISRAVLSGPRIDVEVAHWDTEKQLGVKISADFEVTDMWYRQNGSIRGMQPRDGIWEAQYSDRDITEFRQDYGYYSGQKLTDFNKLADKLEKRLVARLDEARFGNQADLLIMGDAPDTFAPASPNFEKHQGRVLYVIPLANLPKS